MIPPNPTIWWWHPVWGWSQLKWTDSEVSDQ